MKKLTLPLIAVLLLAGIALAQSHEPVAIGPNSVEWTARHADGTVFYHQVNHNLKTYAGGTFIGTVMSTTGIQPAAANYMAVSTNTGTPSASDTSLSGEISSGGLARAQGTVTLPSCSAFPCTYTIAHTWTATSAFTAVQEAAVFNASSAGTMVFENIFTPVNLNINDTLTGTWTISLQ